MTGIVVWFTGLPSSGKSRLAERVWVQLRAEAVPCCLLDGDRVRELIRPRPGYEGQPRDDFYFTLGGLAGELAKQDLVVLVPATANQQAYRDHARGLAPAFILVWLDSGLVECRRRDAKGLYARFARGQVQGLPGEDEPYEVPAMPDVCASGAEDDAAFEQLMARVRGIRAS